MSKKQLIIIVSIILIFAIGFLLRLESAYVTGTPVKEKSFYLDQNQLPYMYELDSYYNYRLTRNYLDHGYLGDTIINGQGWDLHSYYPPGVPLDYPPLIVYVTAFAYKMLNLFVSVPLLVVCFWLSAFIAPLAGVVAYLFTRRYINDYGAVVAGILTSLAPFYFVRTVPGWFDTDMFNVLFPLIVLLLFIIGLESKNLKKGLFFSVMAGLFMFLFATAWNGWQYYFYLIVSFSFIWGIGCYFRGKTVKNYFYKVLIFTGVTIFLLGLLTGYLNLIKLLYGPLEFLKVSGSQSIWSPYPDVYQSVNELSKPTILGLVSGVGFALFGGIFGLIWMMRHLLNKKLRNRYLSSMNWLVYLFLVLWVVTGFLSLNEGSRFMMIIIPPLAISSGILIGICVEYLDLIKNSRYFTNFRRKKYLIRLMAVFIVLLVVIPTISNISRSLNMPPGADDDMWGSLEWINFNTPQDTVVISGWSAGHLITAVADRPVTIDGRLAYIETVQSRSLDKAYPFGVKSPSTAREYWISKAFSTSNESLSYGIFRMLANSGDMAYLTLDEYTGNTTRTVEILNNILGVDNATAKNIMVKNYNLNQVQADNVLKYSHPQNVTPFVVWTYSQMIDKGYWVYYFGNWDFNKNNGDKYVFTFDSINQNGNIVKTSNGVYSDLKTGITTYKGEVPYCVILVKDGNVQKFYLNKSSDICVIIQLDEGNVVVMDKRFENSLFIRMVLERSNTTYFKSIFKNNETDVWETSP